MRGFLVGEGDLEKTDTVKGRRASHDGGHAYQLKCQLTI